MNSWKLGLKQIFALFATILQKSSKFEIYFESDYENGMWTRGDEDVIKKVAHSKSYDINTNEVLFLEEKFKALTIEDVQDNKGSSIIVGQDGKLTTETWNICKYSTLAELQQGIADGKNVFVFAGQVNSIVIDGDITLQGSDQPTADYDFFFIGIHPFKNMTIKYVNNSGYPRAIFMEDVYAVDSFNVEQRGVYTKIKNLIGFSQTSKVSCTFGDQMKIQYAKNVDFVTTSTIAEIGSWHNITNEELISAVHNPATSGIAPIDINAKTKYGTISPNKLAEMTTNTLETESTTFDTNREIMSLMWSDSSLSGFNFTDNEDGTFSIGDGVSGLRQGGTEYDNIKLYNVTGVSNIPIALYDTLYVVIQWNSGSPNIVTTHDIATAALSHGSAPIYAITRGDNGLSFVDVRYNEVDFIHNWKLRTLFSQEVSKQGGTFILTVNSDKTISWTSGLIFLLVKPINIPSFDSSSSNTFTRAYGNSINGFIRTTGQTAIDYTKYDSSDPLLPGSGVTLSTVNTNKYGNHWIFTSLDGTNETFVIYGKAQYDTVADAVSAPLPADRLPETLGFTAIEDFFQVVISGGGVVEKIIDLKKAQKGGDIVSPLSHNGLSGLQGGTTNEYYHLTQEERDKINLFNLSALTYSRFQEQVQSLYNNGITTIFNNSNSNGGGVIGGEVDYTMVTSLNSDISFIGKPLVLSRDNDVTVTIGSNTSGRSAYFFGGVGLVRAFGPGVGGANVTLSGNNGDENILITDVVALDGTNYTILDESISQDNQLILTNGNYVIERVHNGIEIVVDTNTATVEYRQWSKLGVEASSNTDGIASVSTEDQFLSAMADSSIGTVFVQEKISITDGATLTIARSSLNIVNKIVYGNTVEFLGSSTITSSLSAFVDFKNTEVRFNGNVTATALGMRVLRAWFSSDSLTVIQSDGSSIIYEKATSSSVVNSTSAGFIKSIWDNTYNGVQKKSITLTYGADTGLTSNKLISPTAGVGDWGLNTMGIPVPNGYRIISASGLINRFSTSSVSEIVVELRTVPSDGSSVSQSDGSSGTEIVTLTIDSIPNTSGAEKFYYQKSENFNAEVGDNNMLIAVISSQSVLSATGLVLTVVLEEI